MLKLFEKIGLSALQHINPETAHNLALLYLRTGVSSRRECPKYQRLQTKIAGLPIDNPIGLAAGFDKNGTALDALSRLGLGFVEIGAVTPKAQTGNSKPRLFRVPAERAVINHFGFNNDGMIKVNKRLQKYKKKSVIGLNIGANKTSINMKSNYSQVLLHCGDNVDFATINVSSPNTKDLRNFQKSDVLGELLSEVMEANNQLKKSIPIFIKIAPELKNSELEKIVASCFEHKLSGIIATNTSTDYTIIKSSKDFTKGGISGAPLFKKSTKVLARLSIISNGEIPLIGVGGVSSGKDAFAKICAGATAVQLYSSLIFNGPRLIEYIIHDLNSILKEHGYKNVSEAVGSKKHQYT